MSNDPNFLQFWQLLGHWDSIAIRSFFSLQTVYIENYSDDFCATNIFVYIQQRQLSKYRDPHGKREHLKNLTFFKHL